MQDQDDSDSGRVPRTIDVEMSEDLVDSCLAGDSVTVTGIVKASNSDSTSRKRLCNQVSFHISLSN